MIAGSLDVQYGRYVQYEVFRHFMHPAVTILLEYFEPAIDSSLDFTF